MSRHEERLPDYLEHMAESLRRVKEYVGEKSRSDFFADTFLQDAVLRNLAVLGEAANNCFKVMPNVAERYPNIPFARIYGLRNQITHGYSTVDVERVWEIIETDVPKLRTELLKVLRSVDNPPPESA